MSRFSPKYDANGNRASKTLNGVTETYASDDADKLTSITSGGVTVKSFGYDSAGRTTSVTTSAGTTTLAYDYESRVTTITYPSTATNTFTYNGLDTRVGKVDSAGTATYKRDGAHVTAPVVSDGFATYTPGISERRSSTTKFFGADRLGTNSLETNSSQAVTATKTYDAFGMPVGSTGSSASPFGFAGQHGYQEDGDSGLKLLGHRYYDASTGRFLTRDKIKEGRNWYQYSLSRPTVMIDPVGLWTITIGQSGSVFAGPVLIGGGGGIEIDFTDPWNSGVYVYPQVGVGVGLGASAGPEVNLNDSAYNDGAQDVSGFVIPMPIGSPEWGPGWRGAGTPAAGVGGYETSSRVHKMSLKGLWKLFVDWIDDLEGNGGGGFPVVPNPIPGLGQAGEHTEGPNKRWH